MSDLFERIMGQKGTLENWMMKIPGFSGYLDKKARRTADRILRDYVAAEIAKRIRQLVDMEKKILDMDGGLRYMSKTSSVKSKIQLYHDRVATAAPGYSGPFEQVKIGAEEMEKLYAFDEAQIRYVDQMDAALKTLQDAIANKSGVDEAIAGLDTLATEAAEAFRLREDVILNLSKSV